MKWLRKASWVSRAALLGALLVIVVMFSQDILNAYEYSVDKIFPSAARAAAYGDKHFDGAKPGAYSLDRAEYFYQEAAARDPQYPYVYHQLGRIEFLKGNFNTALFYLNKQIELHGDDAPNSYYVRGLIEGFKGDYAAAIKDYERYLTFDERNWAALNDYAWVLLKADKPVQALVATTKGLQSFPENPWLLNSNATALFELKRYEEANTQAQKAAALVQHLNETDWMKVYPGNDPRVAEEGIKALEDNRDCFLFWIEKLW